MSAKIRRIPPGVSTHSISPCSIHWQTALIETPQLRVASEDVSRRLPVRSGRQFQQRGAGRWPLLTGGPFGQPAMDVAALGQKTAPPVQKTPAAWPAFLTRVRREASESGADARRATKARAVVLVQYVEEAEEMG
ncbi:MAG TPA: hypothetical protein VMN76_05940 [Acidobacteriota bacterium]|nr:hypothetical protein [Acidobacteriota bacterium]